MSLPTPLRRLLAGMVLAPALATALAGPAEADDPVPAPATPAPSIALTAPAAGSALPVGVTSTLTAAVPADVALKVVSLHVDDGPPLCVFTRVHDGYACPWSPPAGTTGRHTLLARVETTDGRVATVTAPITVVRLLPARVGATTTRRRLHGGAWRLTTRGSVRVAAGLTSSACAGSATITVLSGPRTVVDRTARVTPDCRFSSRVAFTLPRTHRSVRVKVVFAGAPLLAPRSASAQTVRLR